MDDSSKHWYAVSTHNKSERKVCMLLNKKNIETFYPVSKKVQQWGDKNKVSLEPLFHNHVFIYASAQDHREIKSTDGIRNLFYWLGEPAIINEAEINMLKQVIQQHQNINLVKIRVDASERISVTEVYTGADEPSDTPNSLVKVSLPSLGYALLAEKNTSEVMVFGARTIDRVKPGRSVANSY